MKKYKVLSMDYYDKFKCIGSRCEDTCCKDWNVHIDKKTYKKYKELPNSEFKKQLLSNISRNRRSKSDLDYARLNILDRTCPMISEEGLCRVFQNIGEDNMGYVCKTYPRIFNSVDGIIESSLTLSCIEVARSLLLRKDGIEFNLDVKEIEEMVVQRELDTFKSTKLRNKCFHEIRMFCIGLIQDRRYNIEERLTILGLFINNIKDLKNDRLIRECICNFQSNLENGEYRDLLTNIKYDIIIDAQLEFLINIYEIIISKNIHDKRFIENFVNVVNSLQLVSSDPELIKSQFKYSLNDYYKLFMKDYEYIYENYLVSYMFKVMFPISNMSLMDTYVNLIVHFSIIKMNLVGLCGHYKEEMDDEKVVNFIQSFAKVVEHDTTIVGKLHRYLSENEMNTFAHMVILMGK